MANRVCLTCGRAYDFCGSCPSSANLPMWKNIYDTEDCMNVFHIVSDYAQGVLTKDIAKERLIKYDLSSPYREKIKLYIDEIMAKEKVETDVCKNIENETIEDVVEPTTEAVEEKSVVEVIEEVAETEMFENVVSKNNKKKAYKK